jgi:hypothetical protein
MTLPPSLIKLLKKLPLKKGDNRSHPSRDWLVLLSVFLLLLAVSIAWNIWFFASVLEGEDVVAPGNGEGTVEESSLQRANAMFEARALEEVRYRSEYRFVDPSR